MSTQAIQDIGWVDLLDPEIEYIPPANEAGPVDADAFDQDGDERTFCEGTEDLATVEVSARRMDPADLIQAVQDIVGVDEDEATNEVERADTEGTRARLLSLPEAVGPLSLDAHIDAVDGWPADNVQVQLMSQLPLEEAAFEPRAAAAIMKVRHDLLWMLGGRSSHGPEHAEHTRQLADLLARHVPRQSPQLLRHWAETMERLSDLRGL
jgi:hypothetical protein